MGIKINLKVSTNENQSFQNSLVGSDSVTIGRYGTDGGTEDDMDKDLLKIFKN
ncbi:hypothetical protein MHL31_01160 [Lutibacter sp. A80]|uniref:hypothetical protein n=1 Tax=Lutibacter sp. A80 TaxID=2918453 RepID=UPI001F06EB83|nr:hypothetical protein [Lutibacter sp. A80]UMB60837.1 hypothetical protein MHL31_01160 [Lutibacter sp. A80]